MGKTVVSAGAKFFFTLHKNGKAYSIGNTVKKGSYVFSFYTDLHSRAKNAGEESVVYKTIKIISNGGETVLEARYDERCVRLNLERGRWYRAELWEALTAIGSPWQLHRPFTANSKAACLKI